MGKKWFSLIFRNTFYFSRIYSIHFTLLSLPSPCTFCSSFPVLFSFYLKSKHCQSLTTLPQRQSYRNNIYFGTFSSCRWANKIQRRRKKCRENSTYLRNMLEMGQWKGLFNSRIGWFLYKFNNNAKSNDTLGLVLWSIFFFCNLVLVELQPFTRTFIFVKFKVNIVQYLQLPFAEY